jgi:hypothetical protein
MAIPQSFSNDGAVGSQGPGSVGTSPGGGGSPSSGFGQGQVAYNAADWENVPGFGGQSMLNPADTDLTSGEWEVNPTTNQASIAGEYGGMNGGTYLGGVGSQDAQTTFDTSNADAANMNAGKAYNASHTPTGITGSSQQLMFDGGGSVPDQDDMSDQTNSGLGDRISLALATVDSALAYGRKLNGLGGDSGMDEGEDSSQAPPQQMAQDSYGNNRMPAVPGSQSNSGVPPIQPMPGPLPPTSNPFGKRADAGQTPMIPDDEDNSEEQS